ncbi:MAG: hypothetical protein H0V37_09640 [Chloroflexia bacterium]|nr:hypothetical protein [Chloroflexia bacterium]
MSSPSVVVIANLYAERLAQRHQGVGWHGLTPAQQAVRIRRERAGLAALLRTEATLHDALRAWLTTSDSDGQPVTYAGFWVRLDDERRILAMHRDQDSELGREWRRRYPNWRPDFTSDEYDAWESELGAAGSAAPVYARRGSPTCR